RRRDRAGGSEHCAAGIACGDREADCCSRLARIGELLYVGRAVDRRRRAGVGLIRSDIDVRADLAGESGAALVRGEVERVAQNRIIASVDGWTTGQQGVGEGQASVVLERPEFWIR